MIRLETATEEKKGDVLGVTCSCDMEGKRLQLTFELVTIFETIEEKAPEIWNDSVEMFLAKRGF